MKRNNSAVQVDRKAVAGGRPGYLTAAGGAHHDFFPRRHQVRKQRQFLATHAVQPIYEDLALIPAFI